MSSPFDVDEVARQIKICYTARIRVRGGQWDNWSPGAKQEQFWRKAAEICLREGFEPDAHVRALLDQRPSPYPNMLVGSRAIDRTRAFSETEERDELRCLSSQLARLKGCLNVGETLRRTLTNPTEDFTPAFRYCVAIEAELADIAACYREAAMIELQLRPKLRELIETLFKGVLSGHWRQSTSFGAREGHSDVSSD